MTTRRIKALLAKTCKKAREHMLVSNDLAEAMRERYGILPNDIDCDFYIDATDYGQGDITLEQLDELMTEGGYPPATPPGQRE